MCRNRTLCVHNWLQDEKGGRKMDLWKLVFLGEEPFTVGEPEGTVPSHTARPASEQHPHIHVAPCPEIIDAVD